jgi:2-methylisocitrate lyase-like PEP mutase family enzyme
MSKASILRSLLAAPGTLIMPDAYDPLSARIIESVGFQAVQCSGYSFSLAACSASEADFGFDRNLALTRSIVEAVDVPVMADGEDGFGDPSVVAETVRSFVRAGVAGINLEDQILGQPGVRGIIDGRLMIEKIQAAREAARQEGQPELVINGRTDALAVASDRAAGLRESIERANLYLEAGGDMAFVTRVITLDEVKTLVREIHGPLSIAAGLVYNIRELSIADLMACGVARVSLPAIAVFSAIQAIRRTLTAVRDAHDFSAVMRENMLCSAEDVSALFRSK